MVARRSCGLERQCRRGLVEQALTWPSWGPRGQFALCPCLTKVEGGCEGPSGA